MTGNLSSNRCVLKLGLLALLLAGAAGCKGVFVTEGLPRDPLFLDKRPIEAQARFAPPVTVAYSQPVPPANPYLLPRAGQPVPGLLTNRPRFDFPDEDDP